MSEAAYIVSVPVTPEHVLAVFRDQHRQVCRFDICCDSRIELSFDSTIEDWRSAMDLVETKPLGRAMNHAWGLRLSDHEWREVLHPPRHKNLRGVAELIARHAMRPELRPLSIAGTQCLPAAAFLTIKQFLASDGADVSNLAPSSLLADYGRKHLGTFLTSISQLAPGALPEVDVKLPDDEAAMTLWKLQVGLLFLSLVSWLLGVNPLPFTVIALVLHLIQIVGSWFRTPRELTSVQFGELCTFRDLSKCIVSGSR
jgi:hypothetical protein